MVDWGEKALAGYERLSMLARPFGRALVRIRRGRGKEHADRYRERFGRPGRAPLAGPTVWVHAASVGEMMAVTPLMRRITDLGVGVVLTTGTVTSAAVAAEMMPAGVVHQFAPLDVPSYVGRFLDTWRPEFALFVESELWPATLAALDRREIPAIVCNARMSERSFVRWQRFRRVGDAVFGRIHLCLAQTEADADRFRRLGASRCRVVGNIKFDAPPPEASPEAALLLRRAIRERPMLVPASTHPGEDALVLDAFERLRPRFPDLLLAIAPRHPERGSDVMALAAARGLSAAQRSAGRLPVGDTAVYVADTVGELGTLYRMAEVAFVGGSLVAPGGGHNPIEPAGLRTPMISGPLVQNFQAVFAALTEARAVAIVEGPRQFADRAERLMTDDEERRRQVDAAEAVVAGYRGALDRTLAAIEPFLNPLVVSARLQRPNR